MHFWQSMKRCRRQDILWHHDVIPNCTQGSTNTKHSRNKAAPQPPVEAARSKPLAYRKITTGHVLISISFSLFTFGFLDMLVLHSAQDTCVASPFHSDCHELCKSPGFVQSTMTCECEQLMLGMEKKKLSSLFQPKRDKTDLCVTCQAALKCNQYHCWGDVVSASLMPHMD